MTCILIVFNKDKNSEGLKRKSVETFSHKVVKQESFNSGHIKEI